MPPVREWLEADGLGGYAMGTTDGIRTRRYHALLVTATTPPTGRMALLHGFDAFIETPAGRYALSSQRYAPGVIDPDGVRWQKSFSIDSLDGRPWPTRRYQLPDGTEIEESLFVVPGASRVFVSFRLVQKGAAKLTLRPFLSGREDHHTQRENTVFDFIPTRAGETLTFHPYPAPEVPTLSIATNGDYQHAPAWYRQFLYEEERARGLDAVEDLASPGVFAFDLEKDEAFVIAWAGQASDAAEVASDKAVGDKAVGELFRAARETEEARRRALASSVASPVTSSPASSLDRAAEAYVIRRGQGMSVIAGYPWFTDWGRDTFISLRGLCLATGRFEAARAILIEWAGTLSEGMIPNRFPDRGDQGEFNSVDASLWYGIAAMEYLRAMRAARREVPAADQQTLADTVRAILDGYARGTRFGIALDDDGLLLAGQPGVALTWMDAVYEGRAVTPRIGKPVEVQALWLNLLHLARGLSRDYPRRFKRGLQAFRTRFWNEAEGTLLDVVDCDHRPGRTDDSIRPNQIFAVGGLPIPLLDRAACARVVDLVEKRLWTPLGLRTLDPADPAYRGRYQGSHAERDAAYHQGTAWPWLLGPFVEAWIRVRGATPSAKHEAREKFLAPLLAARDGFGLLHLPEIADGDAPHTPRGAPFQAWSVAEALRLDRLVLDESAAPHKGSAADDPLSD